MKAITLTQPWATLVVSGRKAFETRSWPTALRERVAIHAAKSMPGYARQAALDFGFDPNALPRGAVIGEVTLQECVPTEEALHWISRNEIPLGDYSPGRFAWGLIAPTEYPTPIPATGSLGFWEWLPERDVA
jgi:hypothetical protein